MSVGYYYIHNQKINKHILLGYASWFILVKKCSAYSKHGASSSNLSKTTLQGTVESNQCRGGQRRTDLQTLKTELNILYRTCSLLLTVGKSGIPCQLLHQSMCCSQWQVPVKGWITDWLAILNTAISPTSIGCANENAEQSELKLSMIRNLTFIV